MILILYSDLHIRPERLEDCETVLEFIGDLGASLSKKHGHDNVLIVNGGDTFNTRGLIRTNCFDRLYWHYNEWYRRGLRQVIIVGNHDQEDKAGEIHPMRVFSSFLGWHVVDKPKIIEGITFFPYIEKKDVKAAIDSMSKKTAIAVTHWGFYGAKRNDSNIDKDGIPVEWMEHFEKVFCGHYHYRNSIANIQYIGSPLQQNFGEMGQDKGVIVYDTKTKKSEFIAITSTPRHYEINLRWEDGKEIYDGPLKEIRKIDFVEVNVTGDVESVSNYSKDKALKVFKAQEVKLSRHIKEKAYTRLKMEGSDKLELKSLMEQYVDFVHTDLNKKKLKKMGDLFC